MQWFVYVLLSPQLATYVGITTDLERRLRQHNGELRGGAKSTRGRGPWRLGRSFGPFPDRGAATRAEFRIKKLRGARRLRWQAPET